MTMSAASGGTYLKQIKASPAERINGKVKLPTKLDPNGAAPVVAQNGTTAKATGQSGDGMSPEQRRRASGRPQMTPEEQKIALRKRVEQFIPTINVRNSTTNILAKYKEAAPSLIVLLHPTHFRFDQQDGVFSYNSPMKTFLEYIRDEQIPPEVADVFKLARIKYYDACLIVEVRDHRPKEKPASNTSRGGPFITPSQNGTNATSSNTTPQTKEPPRVYKTLLRPTEQSLWMDFGQLADSSGGEFTDWMGLQVEGGLMLAQHPRLVLDTIRPGVSRKRLFERVCDQTGSIPPRKKVKRESSKDLDDSAERAAEEKMMLLGDLKHDKDFQPRFQILVHKEEWKKKKAEEEKARIANGMQKREFLDILNLNYVPDQMPRKQKVTMDSIQAHESAQAQAIASAMQNQARLSQPPNGISQANQQGAQAAFAVQAQQQPQPHPANQNPQGAQRRIPLPRAGSQDQVQLAQNQRAAQQQANGVPRQLQPTGPGPQNAPTPMSGSPQVPIQRLPATPRNMPTTPRPPGTPQAQASQQKHPTPQPNQAMTPVSNHPSPMMKSGSQGDESQLQQPNGRPFTRNGPQPMMNGAPQRLPPQPFPGQDFIEALKSFNCTYEQYLQLPQPAQAQLNAKVQEIWHLKLTAQGNQAQNPQTVQGAFAQVQNFMQQSRNGMPLQPGQTMTPEQQRALSQTKQQFMGADPDMIRQQLASQGRRGIDRDVQLRYQQSIVLQQQAAAAAAKNGQQSIPQRLQQHPQPQLQQGPKLPNGQTMTAEQYRQQQLRTQAAQRNQAINAQGHPTMSNPQMFPASIQFMNELNPQQKAQFQAMDMNMRANTFQAWLAQRPHIAQITQQGAPQLQYNPMAAQSMPGGRLPGQMVMGQNQGPPNGVGGPTMMRQSTSGGNA